MSGTLYVGSSDVPCVFGVVHPHLLLECSISTSFFIVSLGLEQGGW